ncbi:probable apyrase 6 isoform X2 [Cucurbita maxima]|uniref:Probable apyrase 6 isoform X2 n=1 Tax=Cucurbita maxima TaxID=3661 RepID=A0A6J1I5W6_CUCMA|nr:probable apyrase 6 isoform X2 [Cucurbita maxima]
MEWRLRLRRRPRKHFYAHCGMPSTEIGVPIYSLMRRLNAPKKRHDSRIPIMDPTKLHLRSSSRPNLFARTNFKNSSKSRCWLPLAALLAFAFLFSYILVFTTNFRSSLKIRYGIVIDGGSTGTRLHVFRYRVESGYGVFDLGEEELTSMKVNPGLSAYAEDPDGAGESLVELLEYAKTRVPRDQWGVTEIRLMATAGLRVLELEVQNRILESCRWVLRSSGFKFRDEWASVITGSDEGTYAWVAANYALGTLGSDPLETTGIIELGGASAQVTFVSSEPMPPEFSRTVKFGNTTYSLYSHSFLHLGQNAAHDSLREALSKGEFNSAKTLQNGLTVDPCTPTGFSHTSESEAPSPSVMVVERNRYNMSSFHSKGNFSECRSVALMLLQKGKEKCTDMNCRVGSIFTPKLRGKFLATENFFYTSKFLGVGSRAFLSDLVVAGQEFCGEDWVKLKKRYKLLDEEDLARYCFSSAYIVALLHDSLGIGLEDKGITAASEVQNIAVDWALGAFILVQSTAAAIESEPKKQWDWIAEMCGYEMPKKLSIIGVSIMLLFIAWLVSLKWRKPQLKTIYDLEKGRYIVTRVSKC